MMPEEGGYFIWVRSAMGDFWAVQEGWWTVCYTTIDLSIYPVPFVNYLAYFFPSLSLDQNGSASFTVTIGPLFCGALLVSTTLIYENSISQILLVIGIVLGVGLYALRRNHPSRTEFKML